MRRSSPLKLFLLVAEVESCRSPFRSRFRPVEIYVRVAVILQSPFRPVQIIRNLRPGDEFVLPGGLRRADLLSALGVLFKTSRVKLL
jgi:hypothetical protein